MIRLIHAELLRLRSRRLTWIALGLVLLVIALTQIAVYTSVKPITAAEQAQGQSAFERDLKEYEKNKLDNQRFEQECVDQGGTPADCSTAPKLEYYVGRTVASYREVAGLAVTVSVFVTALALLLLAASLVGAEFSSGSLANWLSFVPERTKVYLSKLIALVSTAAVATAVTSALAIVAASLLTTAAGADVNGVGSVVAMGGRGILVGVIAAVLGFGLALLTRHTIAAAGTVLGYLLLSFVLAIATSLVPALQGLIRLLPENNALALLNRGHDFKTYVDEQTADGTYTSTEVVHTITMGQASLYWAAVLAVVLGVTFVVFRRRDVN